MKRERFEGICGLVAEGKIKWVDNLSKSRSGRVVACTDETFKVEYEGHREQWKPEECKERTYGYRMVFGEHGKIIGSPD